MLASAKSQGKTQQQAFEFVRGMEKLLGIIEAAGRGKVIRPLPETQMKGLGVAVDVARGAVYTPQAPSAFQQTIEGLMGTDRTRRQIFDLIWSPEGVDEIRKYARMSIPDIRTAFAASAAAQAAQADRGE